MALALACALSGAAAQDLPASSELVGHVGGRTALISLYAAPRPDGGWRVTGEYVVLPTLQRRFVEGERSKQLGVIFLKEGNTPIMYGRAPTATLQGVWTGGVLKGTRYGPGGQERERFDFSEGFPPMDDYGAEVRCEVSEGSHSAALAYSVAGGRLKRLDWRSKGPAGSQACALSGLEQRPMRGGLRFAAGKHCAVTLRELGEFVRVTAEDCGEFCAPGGVLEALLVDRRGGCLVFRPKG
jgi:hypothetical protein